MNIYHLIVNYIAKRIENIPLKFKKKYLEQNGLLFIGSHTYGYENIDFHIYKGSESTVKIGKYCSLAPGIKMILGGIHPTDRVSLYPFRIKYNLKGAYNDGMPTTRGPIIIGNDVWIGTDVTIFSGINIGNGAVIAAGSVVTKDVQPYTIVAGNPAKMIRSRFSQGDIDKLLIIEWWNWDEERIKNAIDDICSNDIESFIRKYYI